MKDSTAITNESARMKAAYERRDLEIESDLYAPWQPGEILMTSERKRVAATMLKTFDKFPKAGDRVVEIGYGKLGWLADFISWGIKETDLYGIELAANRAYYAKRALPSAHLKVGDAAQMPWEKDYFDFAVVSTVFSSILDQNVRNAIAQEIARVLSHDGAIILYDTRVNNPRNKNLVGIKYDHVKSMFPDFSCRFRSVTLAPPIARFVTKRSWTLATVLSCVPFLRTHFLAILQRR